LTFSRVGAYMSNAAIMREVCGIFIT
jgi:hypothetical protein